MSEKKIVLKPTELVIKLRDKIPGETLVYHKGFISIERTQNINFDDAFDRLYVLICILNESNLIFPYIKYKEEMKYYYSIKLLKIIPDILTKIAVEIEERNDFKEDWFIESSINIIKKTVK